MSYVVVLEYMNHGFIWTRVYTRNPQETRRKWVGCVSLPGAGTVSAGTGAVSLGPTRSVPVRNPTRRCTSHDAASCKGACGFLMEIGVIPGEKCRYHTF